MKKWMAKSLVIVTSKLWIDEGLVNGSFGIAQ